MTKIVRHAVHRNASFPKASFLDLGNALISTGIPITAFSIASLLAMGRRPEIAASIVETGIGSDVICGDTPTAQSQKSGVHQDHSRSIETSNVPTSVKVSVTNRKCEPIPVSGPLYIFSVDQCEQATRKGNVRDGGANWNYRSTDIHLAILPA